MNSRAGARLCVTFGVIAGSVPTVSVLQMMDKPPNFGDPSPSHMGSGYSSCSSSSSPVCSMHLQQQDVTLDLSLQMEQDWCAGSELYMPPPPPPMVRSAPNTLAADLAVFRDGDPLAATTGTSLPFHTAARLGEATPLRLRRRAFTCRRRLLLLPSCPCRFRGVSRPAATALSRLVATDLIAIAFDHDC